MNIFERQLRKLFPNEEIMESIKFENDVCTGVLGLNFWIMVRFASNYSDELYDALEVIVLSRIGISTNKFTLKFDGIWGQKAVFLDSESGWKTIPGFWSCPSKAIRYPYEPTESNWEQLQNAIKQCLHPFRTRAPELAYAQPNLVYICAPLRGDVEKNIEFARQKAQEVFQSGSVPICPHLMFPPFADPDNPVQDQAAREMGLRLVAACQQINVYGNKHTAGMQEEIRLAESLGIPVKFI